MSGSPPSCAHLQALRARLTSLAAFGQACFQPHPPPPLGHVVCTSCGTPCCVSTGAAAEHATAEGEAHTVFIDVARAELYCARCGDYVYDDSFDSGVTDALPSSQHSSADGAHAAGVFQHGGRTRGSRVGGAACRDWDAVLVKHLTLHASSSSAPAPGAETMPSAASASCPSTMRPLAPETPPLGVRGMNNLGNTCFMASILQALFALPPLKAHFLAGGHCAAVCRARRRGSKQTGGADGDTAAPAAALSPCLACELDAAFQAAFQPSHTGSAILAAKDGVRAAGIPPGRGPWSPHALLLAWWRHSESLASYQQQDAHEFLLTLIAGAHAAVAPSAMRSPSARSLPSTPRAVGGSSSWYALAPDACDCPMHATLAGVLRSEVTCATCGTVSTVTDPFLDLSLEVPSTDTSAGIARLSSCLRRFTRRESLGPGERIHCATCGSLQPGSKLMCVDRLPPVLCLHIKRFSHAGSRANGGGGGGGILAGGLGGNRDSSKVTTHVAFPLDCLDMAPYTAEGLAEPASDMRAVPRFAQAHGGQGNCSCNDAGRAAVGTKYWCAAIVCHLGSMDGGHYVAYVRHDGKWFKCDDSWITAASNAEVAACQAYMLFYAQTSPKTEVGAPA